MNSGVGLSELSKEALEDNKFVLKQNSWKSSSSDQLIDVVGEMSPWKKWSLHILMEDVFSQKTEKFHNMCFKKYSMKYHKSNNLGWLWWTCK